ncbi:hypothetical protein [Streptomyces sp. NPDC057094]|uniref:hypothetical protein n=1 Tax=Streptomyces sp. NPDC057094 TaxID=3346018 RepID=UPI0036446DD4
MSDRGRAPDACVERRPAQCNPEITTRTHLAWTSARREPYANDQGAPNSLIAVSGSFNRSKADKDPAAWLPVPADRCTYAVDWVADKLRWELTADAGERDALVRLAEACPDATVSYEQVP